MSPTPSSSDTEICKSRREVINDLVSGVLCLVLAGGLAIAHFRQSGRLHDDFGRDPGPAMLPDVLLVCLALAGIGLALRGGLALKQGRFVESSGEPASLELDAPDLAATDEADISDQGSLWPPLLAIAALSAFLPLREHIGAAIALSVLGAAIAVLAGWSESHSKIVSAVLGGIAGFLLFALFHYGLSVPL